ncbi:hypothetical protein HWB79_gp177 [Streptomyces phage LukeCage]|jgi:hypothetical protein|uniref:Uncharacterized protein n=1 Tax=Streptomyces phage LukeCage TaxID=2283304 RepID=A0A345MGF4_9CAUD|nr:hypothetical protein HWB79_gp177 [Streptomyces phage LukeCage]AXH69635.1 hypothetical protein SEA_LUKECAGE_117 [Streptomyces phage LukeCage]
MIICGDMVQVKHNRENIDPAYYGKRGRVHKRTRFLKRLGAGEYEIMFFEKGLNHPIMGVMGGFLEEDLEVVGGKC